MFRGTIDGASVHPREVVKRTLALNAAAIVFAHNHPSGSASSLVAVTPRAGAGLIYKRTAAGGGAEADPSDRHAAADQPASSAMQPGKMVRLAGDFQITRHNDTYSVTLASAATREQGRSPRSKTELAMKCWLGVVEYNGCWQSDGCEAAGPVQSVEYLGSTAAGGEVYRVRYQFENNTYVIAPDQKGNSDQYLLKPTDNYWIKRQISPPAAPILIYKRPETAQLHLCHRDWDRQYSPDGSHSWLSNAPTVPGARP